MKDKIIFLCFLVANGLMGAICYEAGYRHGLDTAVKHAKMVDSIFKGMPDIASDQVREN